MVQDVENDDQLIVRLLTIDDAACEMMNGMKRYISWK